MRNVTDLLKCPSCHRKGSMDLIMRKKNAYAKCEACDKIVTERIPYPKHRVDEEGYQLHYRVGEVRAIE